jgi:hypothetical protein
LAFSKNLGKISTFGYSYRGTRWWWSGVGVGREIVLLVMQYGYHGKSSWEGEEEEWYLYFVLMKSGR